MSLLRDIFRQPSARARTEAERAPFTCQNHAGLHLDPSRRLAPGRLANDETDYTRERIAAGTNHRIVRKPNAAIFEAANTPAARPAKLHFVFGRTSSITPHSSMRLLSTDRLRRDMLGLGYPIPTEFGVRFRPQQTSLQPKQLCPVSNILSRMTINGCLQITPVNGPGVFRHQGVEPACFNPNKPNR